jgi:hypothetical protein
MTRAAAVRVRASGVEGGAYSRGDSGIIPTLEMVYLAQLSPHHPILYNNAEDAFLLMA